MYHISGYMRIKAKHPESVDHVGKMPASHSPALSINTIFFSRETVDHYVGLTKKCWNTKPFDKFMLKYPRWYGYESIQKTWSTKTIKPKQVQACNHFGLNTILYTKTHVSWGSSFSTEKNKASFFGSCLGSCFGRGFGLKLTADRLVFQLQPCSGENSLLVLGIFTKTLLNFECHHGIFWKVNISLKHLPHGVLCIYV